MLLTIKLGYREEIAGYYVTGVVIAGSLGMILGGKLADKFGRKKIFVFLNFISASIFVVCALVKNPIIIPWLLIISNLFLGGVFPSINAMIADLTTAEKRKAAFSLIYLGTNIGVAVGPLIAGFLFNNYTNLLFLIDAASTYIAILLVVILVKETIPSSEKIEEVTNCENKLEKPENANIFQIFIRRPTFLLFAFISLIYTFVYSQNYFSMPIYLNEIFLDNGPRIYGTLMSVNAVVVIMLTIFLINLMKNTKPIINIAFAGVLYAIGFGGFFLAKNQFLLAALTIIWTVGEIIQTINTSVYVAENSPITHRARFSSVFSFITEIGFIISPLIMGYFIKHLGINKVWILVIAISVSAAILMYVLYLVESNRTNKIKNNNKQESS
jgi:MFS family permease